MKCKFINVLMFAAGAAIGSAVTWKVVKTKYEHLIQEEIESVKSAFNDMLAIRQAQDGESDEEDAEDQPERTEQINWSDYEDLTEDDEEADEGLNDYERLLKKYTDIKEKGGVEDMTKEPYVISPYDFGELDGYHTIELTYYADGTLEDEDYEIVTDVEELIGPKALTTFGEYEDDSVFVRNERLRTDFQILKDYRTYKQARSIGPDKVDNE